MNIEQQVMNVDHQFCKDCKNGKETAWASYFMENGIMIAPGNRENIVGKNEIEKAMKSVFSLQDVVFDWTPEFCEVADDGSLAVTRGTSKLSYTKDGETIINFGNYTTIWKKCHGKWKISWDIGN